MKIQTPLEQSIAGFSRLDLTSLLVTTCGLMFVVLGLGATTRSSHRATACAAHLRSLSAAVSLYASDSSDYLPYPGWGLAEPYDSWAYASRNLGRNPKLPDNIPDATGKDENSVEASTQLGFQKLGQFWRYAPNHSTYRCPSDDPQTQMDLKRFRGRPLKILSYAMNPHFGPISLTAGKTYRINRFRGGDIAFQEIDDKDPFHFNDGSNSPGEGVCVRHWGGGYLGRIDGGVEFATAQEYLKLTADPTTRGRLILAPSGQVSNQP